jgi:hypothetical protein
VIAVNVTVTNGRPAVVVRVEGIIRNPRGFNRALAERWVRELTDHFIQKNATPNKLGGPRTDFWKGVAADTAVTDVTEKGATITVANQPFRLHLFGGTIVPKKAKALTIPIVPEAHGLMARSYEQKFGRKLFTIGGPGQVPLLFERTAGGDRSLINVTNGRTRVRGSAVGEFRPKTIRLAARTAIRPVYRLAKRAKIERDPDALPPVEKVAESLTRAGTLFLRVEARKGGLQA